MMWDIIPHHGATSSDASMRLLPALVGFLLLGHAAVASDDPYADLFDLLARGDALMAQALVLAQVRPSTEAQVTALGEAGGTAWATDDQAFQQDLYALLDQYRGLPPDVREGVNRLVRFNTYVFNGLTDLTFCKIDEAGWKLRVAAQFLDHAKLAAAGRPAPDWAPDLRGDPKEAATCK